MCARGASGTWPRAKVPIAMNVNAGNEPRVPTRLMQTRSQAAWAPGPSNSPKSPMRSKHLAPEDRKVLSELSGDLEEYLAYCRLETWAHRTPLEYGPWKELSPNE